MKTKQTCMASELKHNETFFFPPWPEKEFTFLLLKKKRPYYYCPSTGEFHEFICVDLSSYDVLHWVEQYQVSDLQVGDLFSCSATGRTETLRLTHSLVTYHNCGVFSYTGGTEEYKDCYIAESLDKTHVFRLRGKEKVERK